MIIGHRTSKMKLNEVTSITFTYYHLSGNRMGYRVLVRFKDGKDRSLNRENILLFKRAKETNTKGAMHYAHGVASQQSHLRSRMF